MIKVKGRVSGKAFLGRFCSRKGDWKREERNTAAVKMCSRKRLGHFQVRWEGYRRVKVKELRQLRLDSRGGWSTWGHRDFRLRSVDVLAFQNWWIHSLYGRIRALWWAGIYWREIKRVEQKPALHPYCKQQDHLRAIIHLARRYFHIHSRWHVT